MSMESGWTNMVLVHNWHWWRCKYFMILCSTFYAHTFRCNVKYMNRMCTVCTFDIVQRRECVQIHINCEVCTTLITFQAAMCEMCEYNVRVFRDCASHWHCLSIVSGRKCKCRASGDLWHRFWSLILPLTSQRSPITCKAVIIIRFVETRVLVLFLPWPGFSLSHKLTRLQLCKLPCRYLLDRFWWWYERRGRAFIYPFCVL